MQKQLDCVYCPSLMHLAEGTLPLTHALGWCALATPVLLYSVRHERKQQETDSQSSLLMAGATCLLIAVTLLPVPVPVVGATTHMCMTPVFALLVGARRIIWPTFFVLLLQALFFAHGGITTLGVNTLSLGLVGPLVASALWLLARSCRVPRDIAVGFACGLGGLSVYLVDACVLALGLSSSTPPTATLVAVIIGFAPVQIPLALVEGLLSAFLVRTLEQRRPELLPSGLLKKSSKERSRSVVVSNTIVLLCLLLLNGCTYEGIDGTVFGAIAGSSGHPPEESLIDLSQGEVGLAMTIIVLFTLGFVAGRVWERLMRSENVHSRES
ncbi:MAG: energy-coupling factor ABC transporter permease [Polyangiaceae bacterium]|nr:energy-coupling factor ABC transporter permease [Polyangiaceae bacterium]